METSGNAYYICVPQIDLYDHINRTECFILVWLLGHTVLCAMHRDIMRSKAEWNHTTWMTEWGVTNIFRLPGLLVLFHK